MDWRREIDELHEFFEAYFLGSEDSIDRLESALSDGFTMIGPDGVLRSREAIVGSVADGYAHTNSLAISITDHQLLGETDEHLVATYIEHHELHESSNHRRTTVIFEKVPHAPQGVRWLHAQETFLVGPNAG